MYTNNACRFTNYTEPEDGYETKFLLPHGSELRLFENEKPLILPPIFEQNWEIDYYASAVIEIPGQWSGKLPFLPLLIQSISGQGKVRIIGNTGNELLNDIYEIESQELNSLLFTYWMPLDGVEIIDGKDVVIRYLLNPLLMWPKKSSLIKLMGESLHGIEVIGLDEILKPEIISLNGNAICNDLPTELKIDADQRLDVFWTYNDVLINNTDQHSIFAFGEGTYVAGFSYQGSYLFSSKPFFLKSYHIPEINFSDVYVSDKKIQIEIDNEIQQYLLSQDTSFRVQWFYNNIPTNELLPIDMSSLDIDKEGIYNALITNQVCEMFSNAFKIDFFNNYTTVEEYEIKIYPNPFQNEIQIAFKGLLDDPTRLDIFSGSGRIVYSQEFFDSSAIDPIIKIDLSSIPDGVFNAFLSNKFGKVSFRILKTP